MRADGLAGVTPKRWITTTTPDPDAPARPDLIGRDFTLDPCLTDTRYCGDITYIRTWEGWLFLATVIDLASRRVVGWATADHLRTDLVEDALRQAVATRRPRAGVVFHSDRGCQYTLSPVRHCRNRSRRPAIRRAARSVLGQRRQRVVLRHDKEGTDTPPALAHPGRRPRRDLQLHRGLVQHPPPALQPRQPQPGPVRDPTTSGRRTSRLRTTPNLSARAGQLHPGVRAHEGSSR